MWSLYFKLFKGHLQIGGQNGHILVRITTQIQKGMTWWSRQWNNTRAQREIMACNAEPFAGHQQDVVLSGIQDVFY